MSATATATAAPRPLAGETVGIPPRQVNYPLSEAMNRYFFGGNALATQFITVLSGAFPPGEDFFVDSVKHYRTQVTDKRQRAQISGFIGQEALHGREHERLNALLNARGLNAGFPEKAVRASLWLLERTSPSQQLACTGLMEHFTALLAEQLLGDDDRMRNAFDEDIRNLWLWHALEELEHKSVAYDVYELIGNSRKERRRSFSLVGATVVPAILVSWAWVAIQDGQLRRPGDTLAGLKLLFGQDGFISRILPKMALYARADFHPDQHNTKKLEARWRHKLFGKAGAMVSTVRQRATSKLQ